MASDTTLVIETATAACSVALIAHGAVLAAEHRVVGRGHAEQLMPMIAALPDGGRADSILVDCGPGSFTGVRVGLAAARGLGIGWGVPVAGFSSMALVAAAVFHDITPWEEVAVVLEGGHGEVFVECFAREDLRVTAPLRSLSPADALAAIGTRPAIGTGVHRIAALAPAHKIDERLPNAADALLLPQSARTLDPRPIYGRAPDAKLPGGLTLEEAEAQARAAVAATGTPAQ